MNNTHTAVIFMYTHQRCFTLTIKYNITSLDSLTYDQNTSNSTYLLNNQITTSKSSLDTYTKLQ